MFIILYWQKKINDDWQFYFLYIPLYFSVNCCVCRLHCGKICGTAAGRNCAIVNCTDDRRNSARSLITWSWFIDLVEWMQSSPCFELIACSLPRRIILYFFRCLCADKLRFKTIIVVVQDHGVDEKFVLRLSPGCGQESFVVKVNQIKSYLLNSTDIRLD